MGLAGAHYEKALLHCSPFVQREGPAVIGIDGRDGAGKTSLSNWLGWRLHLPIIHLDLFTDWPNDGPPQWRREPLRQALEGRLGRGRVAIVEGVMLLDALANVEHRPDLLVFVEPPPGDALVDGSLFLRHVKPYLSRTYDAVVPDLVVQTPSDPMSHADEWAPAGAG